MRLREVLHAHIPTLTRASTLRDAIDKMDIYQFPALVFVDKDKSPIAVITEGDISRAVIGQDALTNVGSQPAITWATNDPITENPDRDVSDALHLMLSRGITLLPVVQEKVLLGVVLRVDLMQAILMDSSKKA